jgi:hypothetical protein
MKIIPSNATYIAIAIAMAMTVSCAQAQEVHKCVDNGHVTYQPNPCAHADRVIALSAAPAASDVEAANNRLQAQKDAHAGAKPASGTLLDLVTDASATTAAAAPGNNDCARLNDTYNDALARQSTLDHPAPRQAMNGAAMAGYDANRAGARKRVQDAEASVRGAGCKIVRR